MKLWLIVLWLRVITISASRTIIDVLSSEPRFSEMIYLLQESRLIPLINRLTACTLLVLTNDQLGFLDEKYPSHSDKERLVRYHLLDGNLTVRDLNRRLDKAPLLETWLGRNGSLGTPDPLGPGRGQMVRVSVPISNDKNPRSVLLGNSKIVEEDILADNGIIHVVDQYLIPPNGVLKTVQTQDNLKRFTRLLNMTPTLLEAASDPKPRSLFIWSDETLMSKFNTVELNYLESTSFTVASEDRTLLLGSGFLTSSVEFPPVLYVQSLKPGHAIYTFSLAGDPVVIKRPVNAKNTLLYNGIEVEVTDILTTNGVIHILKETVQPSQLTFNPIKYMIGLGCERFAATINNTQFRDLLLKPGAKYTILLPPDDSFDIFQTKFPLAHASLELIQYHLIKGEYQFGDFNGVQMVSTLLNDELLGNRSQRIKVVPGLSSGQILFNSEASLLKGGVSLGAITMQKISVVLTPPSDIIDTISHDVELSTFHQLLQVSGLFDEVKHIHGITAFIPTDDAFQADGQKLLLTFLLKKSNLSILRDFIRYCLLTQLVFSTEFNPNQITKQFHTHLNNEPIQVIPNQEETQSPILSAHSNIKNGFDVLPHITTADVFVRTGVIHKTSAMLAPKSRYPYLTARNFIKGNNADTFIMLLNRANLSHLLDGPCRSVSGECDDPNQAYTVLVPTQEAWSGVDPSELENHPDLLTRTLQFHFLTQRIPTQIDSLQRTLSISTLSEVLPFLKVVFVTSSSNRIESNNIHHIKLRTSGAPAPMFSWEAQVQLAGQAHDLSVIFVDNVMFLSQLPSTWTSIVTSFFAIIIFFMSVGLIAYAGYLGHFNLVYQKVCHCVSVLQVLITTKSLAFYNWCRGYTSIPDDD